MPELNGGDGISNPAFSEEDEKHTTIETTIVDEKPKDAVVNLDKVIDPEEGGHVDEEELIFEDLPSEKSLLPWDKWKSNVEEPLVQAASKNANIVKLGLVALAVVLYNIFFIWAIVYNKKPGVAIEYDHGVGLLIAITGVVYAYMLYAYILKPAWLWFFRSTSVGRMIKLKVWNPCISASKKLLDMRFSTAIINIVSHCNHIHLYHHCLHQGHHHQRRH